MRCQSASTFVKSVFILTFFILTCWTELAVWINGAEQPQLRMHVAHDRTGLFRDNAGGSPLVPDRVGARRRGGGVLRGGRAAAARRARAGRGGADARSAGRGRAGMIPTLNASLRWCRPSMQISLFIL